MVDHEVSNGARAVWLDERDLFSDVDIYGQIVTERGVVDVPPIAAPGSPLQLGRPHPTPARDVVSLSLSCASEGPANIAIFDGAGRVVRSLPSLPCGATRSVSWDGRDADGRIVPAGIYFVRAKAGSEMAARAVVLVR
jgi:hypothetical protein